METEKREDCCLLFETTLDTNTLYQKDTTPQFASVKRPSVESQRVRFNGTSRESSKFAQIVNVFRFSSEGDISQSNDQSAVLWIWRERFDDIEQWRSFFPVWTPGKLVTLSFFFGPTKARQKVW